MTAGHPTREERYAAEVERVLRENGLTDEPHKYDSSIHSWRCEHPDMYGPCECFQELRDRLAAALVAADPAPAQPDAGRLPNACKCGDCYHPAFGPNTDGDPCPWCRDCGCAESDHSTQPVPAPEVSRGVAEEAEVVATKSSGEVVDLLAALQRSVDAAKANRADRIVRDALPADDGADCCRERTTAGGCGCGRSGEGETS